MFLARVSSSLGLARAESFGLYDEISADAENGPETALHLTAIMSAFGHGATGCMILWTPTAAGEIADFCRRLSHLSLTGATINLTNVENTDPALAAIRSVIETASDEPTVELSAGTGAPQGEKTALLWDFHDAYDTFGWVAGGGLTNLYSERASAGEGRVLRADFDGEEPGILLCCSETALDLSGGQLVFDLPALSGVTDLSVIVSGGGARARYDVRGPLSGAITVSCDLSDFENADRIDSIAVVFRTNGAGFAELSAVSFSGPRARADALFERATADRLPAREIPPVFYAAVIFLAAATVAVTSFFLRGRRKERAARKNKS